MYDEPDALSNPETDAMLVRDDDESGPLPALDLLRAVLDERDRLRQELRKRHGGTRFAGWFTELPSGMSYRLWEQGGADHEPGYVALYE